MKVQVRTFNSLSALARGDPAQLCPKGLSIPVGFKLSGGSRKFIVLVGEEGLALVIGPSLAEGAYLHNDIATLASGEGDLGGYEVSGGGVIEFFFTPGQKGEESAWKAELGGSTLDFGVYDPAILSTEARDSIQEALGISLSFKWVW